MVDNRPDSFSGDASMLILKPKTFSSAVKLYSKLFSLFTVYYEYLA